LVVPFLGVMRLNARRISDVLVGVGYCFVDDLAPVDSLRMRAGDGELLPVLSLALWCRLRLHGDVIGLEDIAGERFDRAEIEMERWSLVSL